MSEEKKLKNKGYVTILTVLVLLAVTGAIATTLILSSTDALQTQEVMRQGEQALLFSESCVEEGLLRLKKDAEYSGGTFEIHQGTCYIVVQKENDLYTLTVKGVSESEKFERILAIKALIVVGETETKIQVSDWSEE